ncbi:MAG: SGNH/GDSL hydrolase family protein [Bryobacteraceae bacterium]
MRRFYQLLSFCLFAGLQVHAAPPSKLGTLVAVGDSLMAGFQNFSLYTSETAPGIAPVGGQEHGYAQLIAKQAGTDLQNPTVTYPGIPPALITSDSGKHISRYPGIGGRANPFAKTLNFSVPSYTVADALARQVDLVQLLTNPQGANAQDVLAFTVLGLPNSCGALLAPSGGVLDLPPGKVTLSSVDCAVQAHPDTILVSLGSNDALQALTFGYDPTSEGAFKASYHEVISRLKVTNARMMLANVPDVTNIPFLWTREAFTERCHAAPNTPNPTDYVVPDLTNPSASGDICDKYVGRSLELVQKAKSAAVAYNQIIAKEAGANVIILDVNALVADIAANGEVVGGRRLTTAFLGGLFSLDGMHPDDTGYAIIANEAIKTMNRLWGTGIPPVSVEQVAKDDPLFPPK